MADNGDVVISIPQVAQPTNGLVARAVNTPPRSATPPPAEKRNVEKKTSEESGGRSDRRPDSARVDSIDPNALSKALLKEFEDAGKHRDITPAGSPSRKRQRVYGDR